jgi:hypothetical protein
MTDLRLAANDYLAVRRQLGFTLEKAGRLLDDYVTFSERAGVGHVRTELALRWATSIPAHPYTWRRRLGVIRGFARYLSTIDPQTEVPSEDLLRATLPRVAPYLYSQAEIAALMNAARQLTPRLRAATFETVIGLLAVSALRAARRSDLTASTSTSTTARCSSAPENRASSARCRCTTPPRGRFASTAGCVTAPCPRRSRERSSSRP